MTKRELIALGGLLHDIGKFLQRATKETGSGLHSKQKEYFGYAHAELSYRESKRILEILKMEEKYKDWVLSACFHHKPDTGYEGTSKDLFWLRALFRLADWYASTERSELTDIESEEKYKRLRPVFESVKIDSSSTLEESIIKLAPLTLNEDIVIPKSLKEAQDYARDRESELYEDYYGKYSKLWEDFNLALENSQDKNLSSLSHKLSYFYHLFYRYAWCIPASIYDREKYHSHYPDISLFDHSRVVSAIATSLYTESNIEILRDYKDSEREKFADCLKLVIFEGDISGIQKFLYDISNIKGVSKRLRGRSTFLAFLPEIIGRFLLRKLNYPWTNLLYAGGGKFQAIVGYEDGIIDRLKKLSKEVEKSLIKAFGGKLGFVIYCTTLKLSDLKNYSDVIKDLMAKGEKSKKRKFIETLKDFEGIANAESTEPTKLCPSCRWEPIPETAEEDRVCKWCGLFEKVGGKIPKSKYVAFSSKENKKLKDRGFFIEGIGGVYFLEDVKDINEFDDVFIINKAEEFEADMYSTGFKFLAQSVPFEDGDTEEIKSFENLAEDAEGDKKIAYVKADVDNLGLIFMKGLGKNYTISRVATLSRNLDLFFSGYLNTLFDREFKNRIYTVYAGGDDLFIVAPWNIAIEAIRRVREEFEHFTCKNRAFGLSCGIYIATGNYPIRLAAERVDMAESEAKKAEGKDSINVLGETLTWDKLSGISKPLQQAVSKLESREIGRTNMYRIYMLLKEYKELKEKGDDRRYMFYPFFYYYLSRNIKDNDDRKLVESLFLEIEKDYKVRETALFCAKYILMRTRDVRS